MATINVSTTSALNSALKAAKAGDTILLSSGTYTINTSGLTFATDVTIASADAGRPAIVTSLSITDTTGLTLRDLELNALSNGGANPFKVVNSQDIHFTRLDVHGSLDGNPQNDVNAFLIRGSRDVSIEDSEFRDLERGIGHDHSSGLLFARNEFHHLQVDGIGGGGSSNVTITGNLFRDFFPDGDDHPDAIQFWTTNTRASATNIVISGNAFIRGDGSAVQGIFLRDQVGTLPYENVTISGNVVAGGGYNGVMVNGARNVTIRDNLVQGFTDENSWIRLQKVDGATVDHNRSNDLILTESRNIVSTANTMIERATDAGAWAIGQWGGGVASVVTGMALTGDAGMNTLIGGVGGDTIDGGGGIDVLVGGLGNDVFVFTSGDKIVELIGGGTDTIRSDVVTVLPAFVENLELTGGKPVAAHGNDLNNKVVGNVGHNFVRGYAGNDTLEGGAGNDNLQGDAGDDRLIGGAGSDAFILKPGSGRDTIVDFSAGDSIDASAIVSAGGRATLADTGSTVTITFSTGESVVVNGVNLGDFQATPTGWIFG